MRQISNFHTHTELCHHAKGSPAEYYEQAVKESCLALGFSDHCPYLDSFFDYWPNIRMSVEESADYIREISEIKEMSSFPVYAGYECEWEPLYGDWYDELKSTYGADYLILGSHWVTDGSSHIYAPEIESPTLFNKYIDQTIDGLRSGNFAFLAHPDLFMMGYRKWDEQSKAWSQALIDAAVDLDVPLEINGLGVSRNPFNTKNGMRYQYPFVEFWEMVSQTTARVICNSDAHKPEDIMLNAWKARDFSSRFGFEPIDSIFE